MRDRYKELADRINSMRKGQHMVIAWQEIAMLPTSITPFASTGFDRVKESVIGSAHKDVWAFENQPNGDILVIRKA